MRKPAPSSTPIILNPSTFALSSAAQKPTGASGQLQASRELWSSPDNVVSVGMWECGVGTFTAAREGYAEICQIASGSATVTPTGEASFELTPGSILVTPNGWTGVWAVHEKIRKMYVLYQG